jgi:hypothetical protein
VLLGIGHDWCHRARELDLVMLVCPALGEVELSEQILGLGTAIANDDNPGQRSRTHDVG